MKSIKYILLLICSTLWLQASAEIRGPFYNPANVAITGGQIAVRTTAQTATIGSAPSGSLLRVQGDNAASARVLIDSYAGAGSIVFRRADTTAASPSALAADEQIGAIFAAGYGATGYVSSSGSKAAIAMYASETWTDSASGTYIDFFTTPKLSTTIAAKMRLQSTGALTIGTTTDDTVSKLQVTGDTALTGALNVSAGITVGTSVAANGSGIKHSRVTTGSISGAATALVTVTWGTAFANANYTCSAQVVDSTATSLSLNVVHIETISASAVAVRVLNNSAGALTGTLHVICMHD